MTDARDESGAERIDLPGGWFFKRSGPNLMFLHDPEGFPKTGRWREDHARAFASAMQSRSDPTPVAVPRIPDDGMLNAARDWSAVFVGSPIGNRAAIGCWQAMYNAASAPVNEEWKERAEIAEGFLEDIGRILDMENRETNQQMVDALVAMIQPVDGRIEHPRWRHKKLGTTYIELGRAFTQNSFAMSDLTLVVIYRSEQDDFLWVKSSIEFEDGRFERLDRAINPAPASSQEMGQ